MIERTDAALVAWLEEGPASARPEPLARTLALTRSTRQRPRLLVREHWTFGRPIFTNRPAIAAVVALLLVALLAAAMVVASLAGLRTPFHVDPAPPLRPPAVVVRTPSASTPVSASPDASPSTTNAYRWEQVAAVDAPDRMGDLRLLAGSSLGYVALTRSPPAAWFSADGASWTEHTLTVTDGFAVSIETAAASSGLIVVGGSYSPCSRQDFELNPYNGCRARPASWVSTDGQTWQASPPWTGQIGEPGQSGSLFYAVWPVPTGGWDAAQAFDPSNDSDDLELVGPAVWHSPDGLGWTLLKPLLADVTATCGTVFVSSDLSGAADDTGRRLAVGSSAECAAMAWESADGRTWTPLSGFATTAPLSAPTAALPADALRPWRLLGNGIEAGSTSSRATAWESTDLASWVEVTLPGATAASEPRGVRGPSTDVAVAGSDNDHITWVSEGAGPWSRLAGSSPPIETVAWGPSGVVGLVGTWDADFNNVTGFEVWLLRPVVP
jgi:hypothetical protein